MPFTTYIGVLFLVTIPMEILMHFSIYKHATGKIERWRCSRPPILLGLVDLSFWAFWQRLEIQNLVLKQWRCSNWEIPCKHHRNRLVRANSWYWISGLQLSEQGSKSSGSCKRAILLLSYSQYSYYRYSSFSKLFLGYHVFYFFLAFWQLILHINFNL